MLCRNPYLGRGGVHPCGQCMPCRLNRRRVWTHRIMLETLMHPSSAFVTLTYSDESLQTLALRTYDTIEGNLYSLNPTHLQHWLKRFRKAISPSLMRFFAVGEYGDVTQRPHYHVALFNYATCLRGRTKRVWGTTRPDWSNCCPQCRLVGDTWRHGDVDLGTLETDSAQYISGYVTKKMTAPDDTRLYGRHPEFARMSLKPGIGQAAMHDVASTLMEFNLEESQGDVPSSLRHGTRLLPLGRYLRRSLRTMVGKDAKAPESTLKEMAAEMQPLRDAAFENSRSLKQEIVKASDQKVLNMETRQRIHKRNKPL